MNDRQTQTLRMILLVLQTLRTTDRTNGLAGLLARVTLLGAQAGEINSLGEIQTRPTDGAVAGRDQVFGQMQDAALTLAASVALYAADAKLPELLHQVDISASDFANARFAHRPWLATRIADAADSVIAQLAPAVTAQTVTDLRTAITAAETAMTAPRSKVVTRAGATRRLVAVFAETADNLEQIDRTLVPLRKTDPEFYAEYESVRRIVDLPQPADATPSPAPQSAATGAAPAAPATSAPQPGA